MGLKVDGRGRFFVAGGSAGNARVVHVRSGRVLASYQFTTGAGFTNEVVLTRHTAWFTDSQNAELYGVPLGKWGRLSAPDQVIHAAAQ